MSTNPFDKTDPVSEAIRAAHKVRRLSKQEILQHMSADVLAQIIDRIGSNRWVVVDAEGRSCLYDPALRQPFHTENRKYAESVAAETGGVAMVFSEALKIISERSKPND